jgi:hypothetical protein
MLLTAISQILMPPPNVYGTHHLQQDYRNHHSLIIKLSLIDTGIEKSIPKVAAAVATAFGVENTRANHRKRNFKMKPTEIWQTEHQRGR